MLPRGTKPGTGCVTSGWNIHRKYAIEYAKPHPSRLHEPKLTPCYTYGTKTVATGLCQGPVTVEEKERSLCAVLGTPEDDTVRTNPSGAISKRGYPRRDLSGIMQENPWENPHEIVAQRFHFGEGDRTLINNLQSPTQ
jgi:hypothetical protein